MFTIIIDPTLNENEKCKAIETCLTQDPLAFLQKEDDKSILHWAIKYRLLKVILLLLKSGCPVDEVDKDGQTPLHYAAANGLDKLIFILGYYHCDFNALDNLRETALHKAILHANPACVQNLLIASRFTLNINQPNIYGFTAEAMIRSIRNIKNQEALAEAFCTPADMFKRTPLIRAVINELPKLVKLHLKYGADINEQDYEGKTALHYAARAENPVFLLMLCYSKEININQTDHKGNTALHDSVEGGRPNCTKILVTRKNPIDKTLRNKAQLTAEDLIKKCEEIEIAVRLAEALASTSLSNGLDDQLEKEVFHFEQFDSNDYKRYLKRKNFYELDLSIKDLNEDKHSPRKHADNSNYNKAIKRTFSNSRNKLSLSGTERNSQEMEDGMIMSRKKSSLTCSSPRGKMSLSGTESPTIDLNQSYNNPFPEPSITEITACYDSLARSNSGGSFLERDKPKIAYTLEDSYANNDAESLINHVKMAHVSKTLMPLIKKIKKMSLADAKEEPNPVFRINKSLFITQVMDRLKPLLSWDHQFFDKRYTSIRNAFYRQLMQEGLKKVCSVKEINKLTLKEFSLISLHPEIVKHLQALTDLCSGKRINYNDVLIDLNTSKIKCLGLMDFVEPDEIIAHLIKLHPFFSPIQRLHSQFIVFTLVELHDFYGYHGVISPFAKLLTLYNRTCCKSYIANLMNDYKKSLYVYKTNSLQALFNTLTPIATYAATINQNSIVSKIGEAINQLSINLRDKPTQLQVEYISKEFNMVNLQFFQNFLLKEFRGKCWLAPDKITKTPLLEHADIINQMSKFVTNVIFSCSHPQQQANAITLFILVARESLHCEYGPDLITCMAIALALRAPKIGHSKGAALLDKNLLKIQDAIFALTQIDDNFYNYRGLLAENHRALPYISILFSDKIHLYEKKLHPNLFTLGKCYHSLVTIKQNLHEAHFMPNSNLLSILKLGAFKKSALKLELEPKEEWPEEKEHSPRIFKSLPFFSTSSHSHHSSSESLGKNRVSNQKNVNL